MIFVNSYSYKYLSDIIYPKAPRVKTGTNSWVLLKIAMSSNKQ